MIDTDMRMQLQAIQATMKSLKKVAGATLKYDMLSDALYWSDEWPAEAIDDPERFAPVQRLLRYRTTLITGHPDSELEEVWDLARQLFPNWPGFDPGRSQRNDELTREFDEKHRAAVDAFNAIPD